MTSQLLRAKEAGADVILTYGIGPELAQIANGMAKLGWKVPIVGSWTLSMSVLHRHCRQERRWRGDAADLHPARQHRQARKAFIKAYQDAYKTDRMPSPVSAAQGYDSIYLLAAAIKQADSTDGRKIRAALEDLKRKVDGVVTDLRQAVQQDRPRGDLGQHPGVRRGRERPRPTGPRRRRGGRQGLSASRPTSETGASLSLAGEAPCQDISCKFSPSSS